MDSSPLPYKIKSPVQVIELIVNGQKYALPSGPTTPRCTIILGSGFSAGVIPTVSEMTHHDILWWLYCQGGTPSKYTGKDSKEAFATEDRFKKYCFMHWKKSGLQLVNNKLPDPSKYDAGTIYRHMMASGGQALNDSYTRRAYLNAVMKKAGNKINAAHIYLADILRFQDSKEWKRRYKCAFCRTVLTTNFDPLLQRSLQLAGQLYSVTDRPEQLDLPEEEFDHFINLAYVHGSLARYGMINDENALQKNAEVNASVVLPALINHTIIVLGCGGWDDCLMRALIQWSQRSHQGNLYWCSRSPTPEKLPKEIRSILSNPDAFFVPLCLPGPVNADQFMIALHTALLSKGKSERKLPRLLEDPIGALVDQVNSLVLPNDVEFSALGILDNISNSSRKKLDRPAEYRGFEIGLNSYLCIVKEALQANKPKLHEAILIPFDMYTAYLRGDYKEVYRLGESAAKIKERLGQVDASLIGMFSDSVFKLKKWDLAIDGFTMIATDHSIPDPLRSQALSQRGGCFAMTGKIQNAIEDQTAALSICKKYLGLTIYAMFNRGLAYGRIGNAVLAEKDFTEVLKLAAPAATSADNADLVMRIYYNRALAHQSLGSLDLACVDYLAVLGAKAGPSEVKAKSLINLGVLTREMGDSKAEMGYLKRALKIKTISEEDKADIVDRLAHAINNHYVEIGETGQYGRSIRGFTSALGIPLLRMDVRNALLCNRAYSYILQKKWQKAIDDYLQIFESIKVPNRKWSKDLHRMAICYMALKKNTEAIIAFGKIISMHNPPYRDLHAAHSCRAHIYSEIKQYSSAIAEITQLTALENLPANERCELLLKRGQLYLRNGDHERAMDDFLSVASNHDALDKHRKLANKLLNVSTGPKI